MGFSKRQSTGSAVRLLAPVVALALSGIAAAQPASAESTTVFEQHVDAGASLSTGADVTPSDPLQLQVKLPTAAGTVHIEKITDPNRPKTAGFFGPTFPWKRFGPAFRTWIEWDEGPTNTPPSSFSFLIDGSQLPDPGKPGVLMDTFGHGSGKQRIPAVCNIDPSSSIGQSVSDELCYLSARSNGSDQISRALLANGDVRVTWSSNNVGDFSPNPHQAMRWDIGYPPFRCAADIRNQQLDDAVNDGIRVDYAGCFYDSPPLKVTFSVNHKTEQKLGLKTTVLGHGTLRPDVTDAHVKLSKAARKALDASTRTVRVTATFKGKGIEPGVNFFGDNGHYPVTFKLTP